MTQIAETVQRTSDTVLGAANIVRSNAQSAKRGGEVITQVVDTMAGHQHLVQQDRRHHQRD